MSKNASFEFDEISSCEGESPTGNVVVSAKSCFKSPSCLISKTVIVGAIDPDCPCTSSPRLTTYSRPLAIDRLTGWVPPELTAGMFDQAERTVVVNLKHRDAIASLIHRE